MVRNCRCSDRYLPVCEFCFFLNAAPEFASGVISRMLRCLHHVAFRRISVPLHKVMRSSVSLRMSVHPYRTESSYINFSIIDVWIFGLARLVRFNSFARQWRCLCVSIVVVTLFAVRDFIFECFVFGPDDCYFTSDGVLLSA